MALDFACGFECRQTVAGAANSPVENHWDTFVNAPTISTTTVRTGTSSGRINPSATTQYWSKTVARTVVSARAYIRFATFPSTTQSIWAAVNANGTAFIRISNAGQLFVDMGAASDVALGSPISTGVWYRLDILADASTGTASLKARLDGGTEAEGTVSQVSANFTAVRWGPQAATSMDFFWDDIVTGTATGDYPIGPGVVEGIHPNEDGTHSFTAGDFRYNAAGSNIATSATDVNTYVDDADLTSVSDFIAQRVVRSAGYVEVQFPDPSSTQVPQLVNVVLSMHSSTTGANTAGWKLNDDNSIFAINDAGGDFLTDISNTGVAFIGKAYALSPQSGNAWTLAKVKALRVRFGYSTDVVGEPFWDGVVLEVAFPETQTYTPALINQTATTFSPTITTTFAAGMPVLGISPLFENIFDSGPNAGWRLGETSGSALDFVGSATGSYVGSPTRGVVGLIAGDGDRAVNLSGSGQYVQIADHPSLDLGDLFSISMWIKPDSVSFGYLMERGSGGYAIYISSGVVRFAKAGIGDMAHSSNTLVAGETYHIAVTKNGTARKIYINGIDQTVLDTNQTIADSSADLFIGAADTGASPFDGVIDEVVLWIDLLSASAFATNYNQGTQTFLPTVATAGQTYAPALIDQTATTFAPTVIQQQFYSPALINQTAATFDPTVTTLNAYTPALIDQTAQPFSPTITTLATYTPALINQAAATFTPTITKLNTISLELLETLAGGGFVAHTFNPTVSKLNTYTPELINQTAAAFAPTVIQQQFVALDLIDQTAALFAPTVTVAGAAVEVGLINQAAATFTPTVTTLNTYTPALIDQTAATFTLTIAQQQFYTPALINQAAATFAPTVTATASVVLALINQAAVTFAPTAIQQQFYVPALIDQTAVAFAPTLSTLNAYAPALIDQTAATFAPTVTATANISVALIDQTAATFTPTASQTSSVVLALLDQTVVLYAPLVLNGPVWTTPADGVGIDDQPELKFTIPTMASDMHFNMQLDTAATFDTVDLRDVMSNVSQTGWDYWNGSGWVPVPVGGVDESFAGNEARYTVQTPLSGTWYRRVRAGVSG